MDHTWHGLYLACPKCDRRFTILEISANAIGGLRADGVCANCGIELKWETNMAALICSAFTCDQKEAGLNPPQLPAPDKPTIPLTDDDKKFGKDSGIDLEGQ